MTSTAMVTSHSSVLMCISGFSGASYGADMPVKSTYKLLSTSSYSDGCRGGDLPLIFPARAAL
jgi:hypothetical protein